VIEEAVDARWPVSVAFATLVAVVWQVSARAGALPDFVLAPTEVAGAVGSYLGDGTLGSATVGSVRRLTAGFAVGAASGTMLGLVAGLRRGVRQVSEPLVSLTAPLPKIALFPAIALWFGFSDRAVILVIALACFHPSFIHALHAVRGIDRSVFRVMDNLEVSRWRALFQVVLRAALPRVLVGLRVSLAVSFVMVFATEAVSSRPGLGFVVVQSYQFLRYDRMYAAIAVLGGLGFLADRLLVLIARSATRGQELEGIGHR